jgi:beta-lactam-binding protein with PASTA domain
VTTDKNFVITQDPNPGTQVPEGSAVQLKLSSGPL